MNTSFAGIILRAKDRHRTARYYEKLGLETHEHEHGGPRHYGVTPLDDGFVVEIYSASSTFPNDALMLIVPSIAEASVTSEANGGTPVKEVKSTPSFKFAYVTDPDNRNVMLIEKSS